MKAVETVIQGFRDLVAAVPDLLRPLILALAGAVPFVEGEVATMIGVLGGVHPLVAGVAAAGGNVACVALVVSLSGRMRGAVLERRSRRRAPASEDVASPAPGPLGAAPERDERGLSKGRRKVERYRDRFGVPGASLLAPLALPTPFTAALLVAVGSPKPWVLLWQTIAIVLWTTLSTVSAWLALTLLYDLP